MKSKLNFKDSIVEPFAMQTISRSYSSIYSSFSWNEKADDFDFIHLESGIGLEVTSVLTANTKKVLSYENSFRPNVNSIKDGKTDYDGNLLSYYGGSCIELRNLIISSIEKKDSKAQKHLREEITKCELCLCVDDGGWFKSVEEFNFFIENKVIESTVFDKIFIITSRLFLVYENNKITSYQRKI